MVRVLSVSLASFLASSCLFGDPSHDEVARVRAPSDRLEAIVVETNGGATTSPGYLIYIVSAGQAVPEEGEVAWLHGAVRNDSAWGVNLNWESPTRLAVEYQDAKQQDLRASVITLGADTVSITLRSGVTDSSAPAGGMWWNRQRPSLKAAS
jgi:hypothetical protein